MYLRKKMSLSICGFVALSFSIVILCVSMMTIHNARENAIGLVSEIARTNSNQITIQFQQAVSTVSTLAEVLGHLSKNEPTSIERSDISSIVCRIASKNQEFMGVWASWEPNSFDGEDYKADITVPGNAKNGQFTPVCSRMPDGTVQLTAPEIFPVPENDPLGDWYWKPLRSGKNYITPPVLYGDITIISVTAPINVKGKTIGVAGIDYSLDQIAAMVDEIRPYGNGVAFLNDSEGSIIAHPDRNKLGKRMASPAAIDKIKNGKIFSETIKTNLFSGETLAIYIPVFIGKDYGSWNLAIWVSIDKVMEKSTRIRNLSVGMGIVSMLILFSIVYLIATFLISKPLRHAVAGLKDIAQGDGDLTIRLQSSHQDEVGELGKWFNSFAENLQTVISSLADNINNIKRSAADLFNIASELKDGVEKTSNHTSIVSNSVEELNNNLRNIAAVMEESATNIKIVSTAVQDMTLTITQISDNTEESLGISESAVLQARQSSLRITELDNAANAIGKVTETITEISEQTNLLALNATIEAARAGESGKGFAVVANEIKELARQTAAATHDIKIQVQGVQETTSLTIIDIDKISTVINDINNKVKTIADTVEGQSLTALEIAENISQASQGIQDVNISISRSSSAAEHITQHMMIVNTEAQDVLKSSNKVNTSSGRLQELAKELNAIVNRFKI